MNPIDQQRKKLIDGNRREYGMFYDQLRKLSVYQGIDAEDERGRLLQAINGKAGFAFNGTKPFAQGISPGCRLCGEGKWSCLFVNNRCNCNCFYCPAPQIDLGIPETQGLHFADPKNYIDYIRKFGFKGVSLSGGEPLLTFDTTLDFLRRIKQEFGDTIYLWLYTNGTLLTDEKAGLLADAGLDEIRFDLSATAYNTRFLQRALGKVPHVTVEIPAIPEEIDQMKQMAVELDRLGVNFLNLHQMRLTPHNLKNLLHRNYTFLHGQRMTVLESELAALEMIRFGLQQGLSLGINYCSFHYKNHYQKAGFREQMATFVTDANEELTPNGYIRQIVLQVADDEARVNFPQRYPEKYLTKAQLLRGKVDGHPVRIAYFSTQISFTPLENSQKIMLNEQLPVFIRPKPAGEYVISPDDFPWLQEIFLGKTSPDMLPTENLLDVFYREVPARGFADLY